MGRVSSNIDYPLYQITKDPSGFVDNTLITMTYDASTQKITITSSSGVIQIIEKRKLYSIASPFTSSAHTAGVGVKSYYLIFSNGSFTWSESPWTFDQVQVAIVLWNSTQTPQGFFLKEPHGLMPWQDHEHFHQAVSTLLMSGGTYGTITPPTSAATEASPAPTQLSVDTTTIEDEDISHQLNSLASGANYTILHRGTSPGAGDWNWITSNTFPYYTAGTGVVRYNTAAGAWTALSATNQRCNYYCAAVPNGAAGTFRYVFIPGQAVYTSLAAARAESFNSIALGTLATSLPEFFVFMQITVKYNNASSSIIEAITYLRGNRTITVGSGSALSVHNTLSGRDAATQHPLAAIYPVNSNRVIVSNAGGTAIEETTTTTTEVNNLDTSAGKAHQVLSFAPTTGAPRTSTTDALIGAVGTTAQRSGFETEGMFRYNTTLRVFEVRNDEEWIPATDIVEAGLLVAATPSILYTPSTTALSFDAHLVIQDSTNRELIYMTGSKNVAGNQWNVALHESSGADLKATFSFETTTGAITITPIANGSYHMHISEIY